MSFFPFPLLTRRIFSYIAIFTAVFAVLNAAGWLAYLTYKNHGQPTLAYAANPAGPLPEKKAYYIEHRDDYDALFLGDSRTLCGMHPDFIDPAWGRTSYNLSHWATWMPTQYALIHDVVESIPPGTVVVWSVGHKNFERQELKAVYPFRWRDIPFLARAGYPVGELLNVQLSFSPLSALVGRRIEFFEKIQAWMATPLVSPAMAVPTDTSAPARPQEQGVAYIEPWHDDKGRLVSEGLYKTNGAMARREIIPSYYRAIQARRESENRSIEHLNYNPAAMAVFRRALDEFRRAGVNVIINEMEEAPYTYKDEATRRAYRDSFRAHIAPVIKEYGFTFVTSDGIAPRNDDYFDYNHLNEAGAKRYDAALARKLKDAAR